MTRMQAHNRAAPMSRRQLLAASALGISALAMPAWARGAHIGAHGGSRHGGSALIRAGFDEVAGPVVDLAIAAGMTMVEGRRGHGFAVNGSVPGPLVRLREGEVARLNVHNHLAEDSSIHWHGLLLPFHLDGVPGVSFPGIAPGASFTAEFPVRQSGTYWWHSHSNLQEQAGHYGPLVIDPAGPEPYPADRDYVLLLSEFTPMHPHAIMAKLKKAEGYFNRRPMHAGDDYAMSAAERRLWAEMRMLPTDIADVSAPAYTYLANGHGPSEGLDYRFRPGERVRLRVINGSAMSFFNLRIPGLAMTVIAADGQYVRPVEVDEFQIGVAETYDVIVEPRGREAYTIVAESMDRSGMAVATLASAPGLRADVPPLRERPLLTMADMGHRPGQPTMDHAAMGHGTMDHGAMDHSAMDHSAFDMRDTSLLPPTVDAGPGVDMVAMSPVDRMGDPGIGLDSVDHRVLNYRQLVALAPNPDRRPPSRELEIHLTGNMERYMWSFDGRKYSSVSDQPIRFAWNERVRVKLVNDTMMAHPVHLHGHFFELVNGHDGHQPLKHTLTVQPGGSATFDLTANEPGDWAFHCHLLYHMHAGMFQVVSVDFPPSGTGSTTA